jgi:hypothetical protein
MTEIVDIIIQASDRASSQIKAVTTAFTNLSAAQLQASMLINESVRIDPIAKARFLVEETQRQFREAKKALNESIEREKVRLDTAIKTAQAIAQSQTKELEFEERLANARKSSLTAATDAQSAQLSGLAKLELSEFRRQQLAREIAQIKYQSLIQQQILEQRLLEIQIRKDAIAKDRAVSEARIAEAKNAAESGRAKAELSQGKARGASDEELQAYQDQVDAFRDLETALREVTQLAQKDQELQPILSKLDQATLDSRQIIARINAGLEVWAAGTPGQQAAERPLYRQFIIEQPQQQAQLGQQSRQSGTWLTDKS